MWRTFGLILWLLAAPGAAVAQGPAVAIHGNWCGPNFGAGPILDALDAACFRHDMCVAQLGAFNCGCDLAFMGELRSRPWPGPALAEKARAVYEAIAMTPCADPAGYQRKLSLAAADWAAGVVSGREPPTAVLDRLGRLMAEAMLRGGYRGY
ncbi:MAG: hypothetical protein D6801_01000 [Alphaproteobacteria bacterium]|nr:MAG: hypothetical protein D6801_01000 [Alphaproteobacteria bacterium]